MFWSRKENIQNNMWFMEKREQMLKNRDIYRILSENREKNNVLATIIQGKGNGAKFLFSEGRLLAATDESLLSEEQKKDLLQSGESRIIELEDRKIFVEHLRKPNHLVICGGGYVAQKTALLAKQTGFHVTVLEDRPFFADAMRKTGADEVLCDSFAKSLQKITGSKDTYFLVLTRGHRYDGICMRAILQKNRGYVGMMASRKRAVVMKHQLAGEGIPSEILDEIHSPVGLPICAETPEEIAVSILGELIMTKNSMKKTSAYDADLLACLMEEKEADKKKALATIVFRQGSAPREIGTKMVVTEDGKTVGTIGGGCMESRIIHKCLRLLKEENPEGCLEEENMTGEEAEEEGLVCGGMIQVYAEVL